MSAPGDADPRGVAELPPSEKPDRDGLRMLPPNESDIGEIVVPTLLACPFCGSRPFTMCGINDRTGIFVARVTCADCSATVRGSSRDQAEARELAREAWERRTPDAVAEDALAQARAEALEEAAAVLDKTRADYLARTADQWHSPDAVTAWRDGAEAIRALLTASTGGQHDGA